MLSPYPRAVLKELLLQVAVGLWGSSRAVGADPLLVTTLKQPPGPGGHGWAPKGS